MTNTINPGNTVTLVDLAATLESNVKTHLEQLKWRFEANHPADSSDEERVIRLLLKCIPKRCIAPLKR
jgi:hypothetical protein